MKLQIALKFDKAANGKESLVKELQEARARVLTDIQTLNLSQAEITESSGDEVDQATIRHLTSVIEERIRLKSAELQSINLKLDNIGKGLSAAFCSDCGEAINEERLIAVPSATECVPCLKKRERRFRVCSGRKSMG